MSARLFSGCWKICQNCHGIWTTFKSNLTKYSRIYLMVMNVMWAKNRVTYYLMPDWLQCSFVCDQKLWTEAMTRRQRSGQSWGHHSTCSWCQFSGRHLQGLFAVLVIAWLMSNHSNPKGSFVDTCKWLERSNNLVSSHLHYCGWVQTSADMLCKHMSFPDLNDQVIMLMSNDIIW